MQGCFLRFYVHEGDRHHGRPVWEWLLDFIVTNDESRQLLELHRHEKIRLFDAHIPAHFGVINPDANDLAIESNGSGSADD